MVFTSEIVTTDNGFYRVCAIVCNDMKTAVVKKDSIAKKFPGTWVSKDNKLKNINREVNRPI